MLDADHNFGVIRISLYFFSFGGLQNNHILKNTQGLSANGRPFIEQSLLLGRQLNNSRYVATNSDRILINRFMKFKCLYFKTRERFKNMLCKER